MFILAISTSTFAQNVKGKISDEKGEPLIGVSVLVKGTTTGGISDVNGEYSLTADKNAILVFSFIGYNNHVLEDFTLPLSRNLHQSKEAIAQLHRAR